MTTKSSYQLGGIFQAKDETLIVSTLSEMKSVSNVHVDTNLKQVTFSYNPEEISEDFILNTLNSLGYSTLDKQPGN